MLQKYPTAPLVGFCNRLFGDFDRRSFALSTEPIAPVPMFLHHLAHLDRLGIPSDIARRTLLDELSDFTDHAAVAQSLSRDQGTEVTRASFWNSRDNTYVSDGY